MLVALARRRDVPLWGAEQLLEQRAIVHEGLPQLLRVGSPGAVGLVESVRCAIVLHDVAVVDREIGDAVLEVIDGVTARVHGALHELMGIAHRLARRVYEFLLREQPRLRE